MAETMSKVVLSGGASEGGWLVVNATSTLGDVVHTGHATAVDEVWLWATNESVAPVVLTLEWDGVATPQIETIQPQVSATLIVPGWPLTASGVLTAFAGTADVVTVFGYANRITST